MLDGLISHVFRSQLPSSVSFGNVQLFWHVMDLIKIFADKAVPCIQKIRACCRIIRSLTKSNRSEREQPPISHCNAFHDFIANTRMVTSTTKNGPQVIDKQKIVILADQCCSSELCKSCAISLDVCFTLHLILCEQLCCRCRVWLNRQWICASVHHLHSNIPSHYLGCRKCLLANSICSAKAEGIAAAIHAVPQHA